MDENQILEIAKKLIALDPETITEMKALQEAAQTDMDKKALFDEIINVAEKLAAQLTNAEAYKCGGKVRAKMKKAACGCKVKSDKCGAKVEADKCGGKTKKVKKGETGIELPKGAHGQTWSSSKQSTTVFNKGGKPCPCMLKKVGGKLIEVDGCTGLPVHRDGGFINYLNK